MNSASIFSVPDNESIVFSQSGQESLVWTESQLFDTNLHSLENSDWFFGLEVPHDNWGIGQLLENGTFLAGGDDVAGL